MKHFSWKEWDADENVREHRGVPCVPQSGCWAHNFIWPFWWLLPGATSVTLTVTFQLDLSFSPFATFRQTYPFPMASSWGGSLHKSIWLFLTYILRILGTNGGRWWVPLFKYVHQIRDLTQKMLSNDQGSEKAKQNLFKHYSYILDVVVKLIAWC